MATRADTEVRGDGDKPEGPSDLGATSWKATLKRALSEFSDDNGMDWAAALTYYAVLSLFPALIALVGLVSLVMDPRTLIGSVTAIIDQLGPASAVQTLREPLESLASNTSTGLVALVVGVVTALWTASGYVGAFMRASNAVYEAPEGREAWKLRPLQMLVTLVILILVALTLIALVVSGPVAEAVGRAIGLGGAAVTIYETAKWPLMALVVITIIGILYYVAPNAKLPKFKWISLGSVFAVVVWVIVSVAFAVYVANFGSYDKTYGTLGGVVVFLVWLWITNIAVLLGQEINSEVERTRQLKAGQPAERRLQLERRDEPTDKQLPDTAHGAHPAPHRTGEP